MADMIDLRYVKKLIEMLDGSSVDSVEISSDKGMKIRISKTPQQRGAVQIPTPVAMPALLPPSPVARINLDAYRELARIGVNLNQAVRELHAGTAGEIPREVIAGLFQAVLTVQRQVIGGGGDDRQPE